MKDLGDLELAQKKRDEERKIGNGKEEMKNNISYERKPLHVSWEEAQPHDENPDYKVCPWCKTHHHNYTASSVDKAENYSTNDCDCKTVFIKDGQTHGQCMCYNPEHK